MQALFRQQVRHRGYKCAHGLFHFFNRQLGEDFGKWYIQHGSVSCGGLCGNNLYHSR